MGAIQLSINIAHGFGRPGANIDPKNSYQVGLGGLVVGTMVMVAPVLSKTSFILTLTRISGPKLIIALWAIAISMNVFQAAAIIVQFVQCTPLEKVWNPFMPVGQCWDYHINLGMSMGSAGTSESPLLCSSPSTDADSHAAYSGVMDLVLAAIPWIVLKDLQIKKKEKIGIAVAMSMGVVAAVTAFIKCAKLQILASSDFTCTSTLLFTMTRHEPKSRTNAWMVVEGGELIIWASTEISTTIVAASIPVLRTLAREISTGRADRSGAGYFRSTSKDERNRKSRMTRPGTNVVSVSAHGHGSTVLPDAASDKSILEGRPKIIKTEEVTVNFGDRGDEASIGYEMSGLEESDRRRRFD